MSTTAPLTKNKTGRPWKGPRRRFEFKVDLTTAELLRVRAQRMGVTVSDYVGSLVSDAVRR